MLIMILMIIITNTSISIIIFMIMIITIIIARKCKCVIILIMIIISIGDWSSHNCLFSNKLFHVASGQNHQALKTVVVWRNMGTTFCTEKKNKKAAKLQTTCYMYYSWYTTCYFYVYAPHCGASGRAHFIRLAKIEISCRLKHRQASWDNNESGIMGWWWGGRWKRVILLWV